MKIKNLKVISIVMVLIIALTAVFSVSFSVYADEGGISTVPTTTVPAPKVPEITGLKKISHSLNSITIQWNKLSNVSGYAVYGKNAEKKMDYKLLKEIKGNKFTLKNIPATTRYHFAVKAIVSKNGNKYYGKGKIINTATETASISGVKLVNARKSITIQWNQQKKVTGYVVYRASAKSNGEYVVYKTIKGSTHTKFTDSKVSPGKLYYYRVKGYRTYSGIGTKNSALSKGRVFTTVGLDAVKTSSSSQLYKVTLDWKENKAASKYKVYYSGSKNGKYSLLATTSGTRLTTKKLTDGKTYYFKVVPIKKVDGKIFSSPRAYIVSQKVNNRIFGESIGQSYIEISLRDQHMWMYKHGDLITETDVVTGNDDGVHNTPKGVYSMMCHQSPSRLRGETWDVQVSFWMQFTSDGCGIHDSTWRGDWEYGGTTYKGNGSHGCVNTPYDKVKKIFNNSYVGYTIVVRK